MKFADFQIKVTYVQIGDHLLVHMFGKKLIDTWMLYDIAELSKKTGQTPEQIVARLCKKKAGD